MALQRNGRRSRHVETTFLSPEASPYKEARVPVELARPLEEAMMRRRFAVLAAALLAAGAIPRAQSRANPSTVASARAQTEPSLGALPAGTAVNVQLNSSVDSKKVKAGEKVEAHTTEAVTDDGRTLVPQGAKLEGHVTEATARSKGDSGSTLAIQFDKAIPKKGEEIPLNVLIMAVAAPPSEQHDAFAGSSSDPMADRGAAAAGGSPMGGGSRPQNTSGTPNYSSGGAAGGPYGSPTATNESAALPAKSRGVYGLRDLKLMETKSETAQTTVITSAGKSVHLDGGTRLLLIAQPTGAAEPAPSK